MKLYTFSFSTMGSPCSIKFYANSEEKAATLNKKIIKELKRLNDYYTNYTATSFTAKINLSSGDPRGIIVDDETAGILDYADQCYRMSDGLFDISSGILHKLWDFRDPSPKLPTKAALDHYLSRVGWAKVLWNRPHLILPVPGMVLDFGGIVKEYAVDVAVRMCMESGVHHGCIELGGDVGVIGPHIDGRPWGIGIQDPANKDGSLTLIPVERGAVASSGNYERFSMIDGVRYSHIIHPKTGYPVQGVSHVTVLASPCIVAGSLSTIAFLKGGEGKTWLSELGVPYIFVDDTNILSSSFAFLQNAA